MKAIFMEVRRLDLGTLTLKNAVLLIFFFIFTIVMPLYYWQESASESKGYQC